MTQSELSRLFRGLASLLHAGIGPGEGLALLAQEEDGEISRMLEEMARSLEEGASFSNVMDDHFPAWCRAMAAVGEQTGHLEEALGFLAEYCDEGIRTRRLLKQSLTYPAALFALMLLVIGLLLTKVLPVFDSVYASLGTGLTGLAGQLLALGQGIEKALPVLMALLATVLLAAVPIRFTGIGNYVNSWFQKTFGDRFLLRKFNNARFARALALGIGSGMTAEEAVALAGQLLSDIPGAAGRCQKARNLLDSGEDLAVALREADLLSAARGRMLAIGLRSGDVDRILNDTAHRLEEDARQAVEDTLAKIEPALVLISAALVGLILLSVMIPLLDILTALG